MSSTSRFQPAGHDVKVRRSSRTGSGLRFDRSGVGRLPIGSVARRPRRDAFANPLRRGCSRKPGQAICRSDLSEPVDEINLRRLAGRFVGGESNGRSNRRYGNAKGSIETDPAHTPSFPSAAAVVSDRRRSP